MSIGERIIDLRKNVGLSQGKLASLLDVSRQAVSKWENDQSCPDTIKMIQLADVLNTDIEYLATGRHAQTQKEEVIIKIPEMQEKIVEKIVEKPIVQYIEKTISVPVEKIILKRIIRYRYIRNPIEFFLVGFLCFFLGFLVGAVL